MCDRIVLCVGKEQTFSRVVLWSPWNEHKHLQLLITVLKDHGTAYIVRYSTRTSQKQKKRVKLFNKSNNPKGEGRGLEEGPMATDDDAPNTNK